MNVELRAARLSRGLTIKEAAKKMKVPATTLAEAERGLRTPTPGNALKIARFYKRDVFDFWPMPQEPQEAVA